MCDPQRSEAVHEGDFVYIPDAMCVRGRIFQQFQTLPAFIRE
jgi:hypothetical protein